MSDPIPPPQQVPAPFPADDPAEPITGSHYIPATKADLKAAGKETAKIVTTADVKWFLGTICVIIAGTAATIAWGSGAMDDRVHGGVGPLAIAQVKVEERVTRLEVTVQQQAVETVRNSTMLEMLVKAQGLTPPPPAPKVTLPDGGVP